LAEGAKRESQEKPFRLENILDPSFFAQFLKEMWVFKILRELIII